MFDFIFDLFRREKPLYRWRERPSLSAFMTNVDRKRKPLQFWRRILAILGMYWALAAVFAGISVLTNSKSLQADPVIKFLEAFLPLSFALTVANFSLIIFSSFADRIVELFDDRLRFQESNTPIFYKDLEFFALTQMIHSSSGALYPCVVVSDRNQETVIIGIPNPRVGLRVTEILSSRVMLRTDFEPIMLEDEKT